MQWILWVMATNTVLALVPAALALLAAWRRRPALAHVLWLLVLVKLVLPPVWNVPVLAPQRSASPEAAVTPASSPEVQSGAPTADIPDGAAKWTQRNTAMPAMMRADSVPPAVQPSAPAGTTSTTHAAVSGTTMLAVVWLGGSGFIVLLTVSRVARFRSQLFRVLMISPALEVEVKEMARQLGLRRPPAARLGPAGMSPMIWFFGGRPLVIVPNNMIAALSREQRAAILAHELAHLKRHDHWIRLFELAATTLLWWQPLLWLARLGLRAAEEQACDALVVRTLGDAPAYAAALVEAIELVRNPAPAYVSGLGLKPVKRRLDMILEAKGRHHRMAWMLVAAVAALLPFTPVRGQTAPSFTAAGPRTIVVTPGPTRGAPVIVTIDAATATTAPAAAEPKATPAITSAVKALLQFIHDSDHQGTIDTSSIDAAMGSIRGMGPAAIPALRESAGSPEPVIRANAVRLLGELHAPHDAESLAAVTGALKDTDSRVRQGACRALGYFAESAATATPALAPLVNDTSTDVRRAAIMALVQIHADPNAAVPALTEALKDKDMSVRALAAQALGEIVQPQHDGAPSRASDAIAHDPTQSAVAEHLVRQAVDVFLESIRRNQPVTLAAPDGSGTYSVNGLGGMIKADRAEVAGIWVAGDSARVVVKQVVRAGDTGPIHAGINLTRKGSSWLVLDIDPLPDDASVANYERGLTSAGGEAFEMLLQAAPSKQGATVQQGARGAMIVVPSEKPLGGAPAQIANLKAALATFEAENGRYPTTAEGLEALVKKPEGIGDTWQKLLDGAPKDPWGHDFIYKAGGPNGYELRSTGPDGKPGSASN